MAPHKGTVRHSGERRQLGRRRKVDVVRGRIGDVEAGQGCAGARRLARREDHERLLLVQRWPYALEVAIDPGGALVIFEIVEFSSSASTRCKCSMGCLARSFWS